MYRSDIIGRYTYIAHDRNGDGKTKFSNSKSQGMEFEGTFNPDGSYDWGEPDSIGGFTLAHLSDNSAVNLVIQPASENGRTKYIHILTVDIKPQAFHFGNEIRMDSLAFNDLQLTYTTVRSTEGKIADFWGTATQMISSTLHAILRADMYGGSVLTNGLYPSPQYEHHDPIAQFFYRYEGSLANDEYWARLYDENFLGNVVADLGAGDDEFTGSDRTDIAYGGDGNDTLRAYYDPSHNFSRRPVVQKDLAYGDILDGGPGNDTIYGQLGATMIGGDGTDRLIMRLNDSTSRKIVFSKQKSGDFDIGGSTKISGFEVFDLTLSGGKNVVDARDFQAISDFFGQTTVYSGAYPQDGQNDKLLLDHTVSSNRYSGFEQVSMDFTRAGASVNVSAGNNTFRIDGGVQHSGWAFSILGSQFADDFDGSRKADALNGNGGNDFLFGHSGNDRLDGGQGADQMSGGRDDDIYFVDNVGDTVIEGLNWGTDTVHSTVSFTLEYHVERLTLTGSASIDGTGSVRDNILKGNSGHNVLNGGGGADRLYGGSGSDTASYAGAKA
ncbi:hypothetical protein GB928_028840, partial [Shinella curvata]